MALQTPPLYLQAGSYSAARDRQHARAFITRSGVRNLSEAAVTQTTTASMTLNVSTGYVFVPGAVASEGIYVCYNDATETVTVPASDTALPRIDLVVARVRDAAVTGSTNSVVFEVVQGTEASTPVAPGIPALSVLLAQVAVAANTSAITNSNITDKRVSAGTTGGIVPVADASARTGLTSRGSAVYRLDTGDLEIYNGSAWIPFEGGTDTGWLTTGITARSGWSISSQVYRKRGSRVTARVVFTRTGGTIAVGATGNIPDTEVFTLPAGFRIGHGSTDVWVTNSSTRMCSMFSHTDGITFLAAVSPGGSITNGEAFGVCGEFYID